MIYWFYTIYGKHLGLGLLVGYNLSHHFTSGLIQVSFSPEKKNHLGLGYLVLVKNI